MALDNPLFKPRKLAPESVFVQSNKESLMSRVNEIITGRDLLHAIPSAEYLLPSKEQIETAVRSTKTAETFPVAVAAGFAVAQTEKEDFEASSRLAVSSSYVPDADAERTPATPTATVSPLIRENTGPEVDAARQIVADVDKEAA